MVNILIVDDAANKIQAIRRVLEPLITEDIEIIVANCINSAKRELKKRNFDIMILDICLPQIFGENPQQDGGMRLLKTIKDSKFYSYPRYVISVSRYEQSTEVFSSSEGKIHTAIFYDEGSNAWENKLNSCVEAAISIVKNTTVHRIYDFDIAVICALEEEAEMIKNSLVSVEKYQVEYDDDIYYKGFFDTEDKKISVVLSFANQMGMVAATSLATKMINNFAPRYMVMTGITGGTKPDKMNFGDVIVANTSWDYRAGKDIRNQDSAYHLNSINALTIDTKMTSYCRNLSQNKTKLREIKDNFRMGDVPGTELQLLIGPVVSGASVVTDPEIVKDVLENQDRQVLGIEMEIYGMYYAANWGINPRPKFVALKAVSDFADSAKGDKYHKYASYTSAKVFEVLAKEYFEYEE
ncbi:5'-methylthioadenosine/S-adenosylhomocysteine nucleosidase family protein [Blautia faecicola]|uniref:Stage 0 sporulation protein A homolog n=1 Tax=Blautia faecicola TaxID=2509240 RepID=A0A4Q1RHT1_9FIRM|nr:response regulator [Blautia faecicola]RXS75237.1 response regulator [Blautia faecicola]